MAPQQRTTDLIGRPQLSFDGRVSSRSVCRVHTPRGAHDITGWCTRESVLLAPADSSPYACSSPSADLHVRVPPTDMAQTKPSPAHRSATAARDLVWNIPDRSCSCSSLVLGYAVPLSIHDTPSKRGLRTTQTCEPLDVTATWLKLARAEKDLEALKLNELTLSLVICWDIAMLRAVCDAIAAGSACKTRSSRATHVCPSGG